MKGKRKEENVKRRDRKKRPAQDRILWRSIKSWQVQSFLRDDPGNGRAVALLIPLPAANFSLSLLFFVSWSSPDAPSPCLTLFPCPCPPSLCRLTRELLSIPFLQPFLSARLHNASCHCYPFPFPCLPCSTCVPLFVRFDTMRGETRNIFILPRTTRMVIDTDEVKIHFRITAWKQNLSSKTTIFLINNPHNPNNLSYISY